MTRFINDTHENSMPTKQNFAGFLALFASTGTLLCCALPATIAAVAGGSAVASFVSAFPWLIPLSASKGWLFLGSGLMILFSAILVFRPKGTVSCSVTGGKGCEDAGRFTRITLGISAFIYTVGAFSAYALVPILRIIDG